MKCNGFTRLALLLCGLCLLLCGLSFTAIAEESEEEDSAPKTYSMDFDDQKSWEIETKKKVTYGYTRVVYCEYPTHPSHQAINLYVPAEYLNEDGSVNTEAQVGDYTAETAPILYINSIGAYLGVSPYKLKSTVTRAGNNLWYYNYLRQGYVLAFVGGRGRTQNVETEDGTAITNGKAPIGLVDLKAGVRFLKANSGKFPGDTNKIISNGMSAGGAMSVLLGVTGNSGYYLPYLEEMGAVMDATDDVYAVQAYCPIIDLEYAGQGYEWMFGGHDSKDFPATAYTAALSEAMAEQYVQHIAELELGYTLENGAKGGSLYDWLIVQYEAGFEAYVARGGDTADVDAYDWLSYDTETGKATVTSIDEIIESGYYGRSKVIGAFDTYELSSSENSLFGKNGVEVGSSDERRHYSVPMAELLPSLLDAYPTEAQEYVDAYSEVYDDELQEQVWAMNPYHFVEDETTTKAQYYRICVGTKDTDTSPSISGSFALLLQKAGFDVQYELIWNEIHTDADYENGFESWVDSVCK